MKKNNLEGSLIIGFVVLVFCALPLITGALIRIAVALQKIEQKHNRIEQIRQELNHLRDITYCLEPAREEPGD